MKVCNIRRNPRVVLTVGDTVGYGTPLTVIGAAELIAYAKEIGRPRVIIWITPDRIRYGA